MDEKCVKLLNSINENLKVVMTTRETGGMHKPYKG